MIRRSAPGKLFIAGEYAVMEPGHPAILIAVDRRVTVTVSESRGETPGSPHVESAVAVARELLAARGAEVPPFQVTVESDLHDHGTKLGLGSSGAVTVATVAAAAAYAGIELTRSELFRLALLATARIDARASGGDLAASIWGGWIAYRAPDRTAVLALAEHQGVEAMLRAPWPDHAVRPLPPPRGLTLAVGWTSEPAGTPASTGRPRDFLARSDDCVRAAIRALDRGSDGDVMEQIRAARLVLAELDEHARLGIFTDRLTALCEIAETVGAAAKPSGAGGGDCGIALLDAAAPREQLYAGWTAAGVQPLPIRVEPTNGSAP